MDKALHAFDEETEKKFQGSLHTNRPTSKPAHIFQRIGDWIMNHVMNWKWQTLIAGAVTASLALTLVYKTPDAPQRIQHEEMVPQAQAPTMDDAVDYDISPEGGGSTPLPSPSPELEAPMSSGQPSPVHAMAGGETRQDVPARREHAIREKRHFAEKKARRMMMAGAAAPQGYHASMPTLAMAPSSIGGPHMGHLMAPPAPPPSSAKVMPHPMPSVDAVVISEAQEERDQFQSVKSSPVHRVAEQPVSTFSVDVDSASYSFVRRMINQGRLPQPDAVRVEEMINYFDYDYALPQDANTPFQPTVAIYPTPWNPDTKLMHIGIKGYRAESVTKPRSNLVFLLDVSGSMHAEDKLPLLKKSLGMLVNTLEPEDTVAIVVYAGAAGTVLEPTSIRQKHKIMAALNTLRAGGSTAGGQGIELAYSLAQSNFDQAAVNRVILATDGDFNVGVSNISALKGLIARKRESGVFLSVLGFGRGNYNDHLMQQLAQNGNGIAAYIDSLNEARKVLVQEASANLFPIAKDVKIQVEFNPKRVSEYRLIGYETRHLAREDFNNDKVDAGDIGAGHTVTALYEIVPVGSPAQHSDPLRYGKKPSVERGEINKGGEFAYLKLRYKLPGGTSSRLISQPITDDHQLATIDNSSTDQRFAAAVAAFGQSLKGGKYLNKFGYNEMIKLALEAKGQDRFGYRAELINLMRLAQTLAP
ncbi:MAG: VWA domain-containing protein [Magnetococcales bacterium]|nr:VWA domain-containing protein [Magnetococcales bacterium]